MPIDLSKLRDRNRIPEFEYHPHIPNVIITNYRDVDGVTVHLNFECMLCQFSTLNENSIEGHMRRDVHPWGHKDGLHPIIRALNKLKEATNGVNCEDSARNPSKEG